MLTLLQTKSACSFSQLEQALWDNLVSDLWLCPRPQNHPDLFQGDQQSDLFWGYCA